MMESWFYEYKTQHNFSYPMCFSPIFPNQMIHIIYTNSKRYPLSILSPVYCVPCWINNALSGWAWCRVIGSVVGHLHKMGGFISQILLGFLGLSQGWTWTLSCFPPHACIHYLGHFNYLFVKLLDLNLINSQMVFVLNNDYGKL